MSFNIIKKQFRFLIRAALVVSIPLYLSSCKGDDEPNVIITIESETGADVIVGINQSLQLNAFVDGVAFEGLTWESSSPETASVNGQGLVSARRHGVTTITATDGTSSGEFVLQVFNVSGEGNAEFDSTMVAYMRTFSVPGVAYAVVKNNKLVMARGYGVADIENFGVVTPTSIFRIADISKIFTSAAILKLVDSGQLNLNERMFSILQDILPQVNLGDSRLTSITVGQLLNHSSGINLPQDPMFNQADVAIIQEVASPPPIEEILAWWTDQSLAANPGEAFAYQNMNYVLLGRIIEAKSGQTYEEYVKEHILDPIGVTAPKVAFSHKADRHPNEVSYYHPFTSRVLSVFDSDGGFVEFPYGGIGDLQLMDSHGGWTASVVDLARFALATDGDPTFPDIISAESQALMVTEAGDSGFSAGWLIDEDNYSHSGAMPGTISTLYVHDDGTVVVGLLNSTHDFSGPTLQQQFLVFRDFMRDLARSVELPDQDLFGEF